MKFFIDRKTLLVISRLTAEMLRGQALLLTTKKLNSVEPLNCLTKGINAVRA